jgi:protein TonB
VISGPDIFRGPAMEAVKNWRYRPYKLNNQPVEVQTTIRVIFSVDQQH